MPFRSRDAGHSNEGVTDSLRALSMSEGEQRHEVLERTLTPDNQIRCSRTIPLCSRCSRRKFDCRYPEPPRRRLVASTKGEVMSRSTCVESGQVDTRDEYPGKINTDTGTLSPSFSPPQTENSVSYPVVSSHRMLNSYHALRFRVKELTMA